MFQPAKKKLKSSTSTNSSASAKKVVDVEIKVGVAYNNDGIIKCRRGKTHTVKVKSNAGVEEIMQKATEKHSSFDQTFDHTATYILLYPDFKEVKFIPGTIQLFDLASYKEAIGREYKRLSFFLMLLDDYTVTDNIEQGKYSRVQIHLIIYEYIVALDEVTPK